MDSIEQIYKTEKNQLQYKFHVLRNELKNWDPILFATSNVDVALMVKEREEKIRLERIDFLQETNDPDHTGMSIYE